MISLLSSHKDQFKTAYNNGTARKIPRFEIRHQFDISDESFIAILNAHGHKESHFIKGGYIVFRSTKHTPVLKQINAMARLMGIKDWEIPETHNLIILTNDPKAHWR